MSRVVVVCGASGVVGVGFIRACLESTHDIKVVGVFRSDQSAEKTKAVLGNPPESKFVATVGNFESEQNGSELLKSILAKVGDITDVISSIGAFGAAGPILDLSYERIQEDMMSNKIKPSFICAKTFVKYLLDKPNSTFTVINGGLANFIAPNFGSLSMTNAALAKLSASMMFDNKDKAVRLNEFMIACMVKMWDNVEPPAVSNIEMGKALLGVLVHSAARGLSMIVTPDNMETIASTGITDSLNVTKVLQF